jgi:hypothetical protein
MVTIKRDGKNGGHKAEEMRSNKVFLTYKPQMDHSGAEPS